MKISKTLDKSSPRLFLPIVLFGYLCFSLGASAQTVDYKETAALLQTKVHLKLGETTLAKTLAEISKQAGLHIQASEYLLDRELLVELDNMSAQAVLDTLAEGNDWIWYEGRQGQIFMARPKFNKTQELLNVTPAFRAIVPKDLRRFVRLDLSDAELRKAFRQLQPESDLVKKTAVLDSVPPLIWLLPRMLDASVKEQESQIISWVTDEVRTGKKIPCAKLTSEQQNTLLAYFVLKAMDTVFSPMGPGNLIRGLDPAGVDENQMRVMYTQGSIFIGILREGKFSYGEGIMSEKELPDPLLLHPPL